MENQIQLQLHDFFIINYNYNYVIGLGPDCDANTFVSPVTRSGKIKTIEQMQELTNGNYSEIKLYSIFRIEYKAIEFSTNKKEPTITFPTPILERQRGSFC